MWMRRRRTGRRRHLIAAVIACACAPVLGAAPSWAAELYAAPSGQDSGACLQSAPCSATRAVSDAQEGDTVNLAPGTYTLSSALKPRPGVTLQGLSGQPAPQLVFSADVGPYAITLAPGSAILRVDVRALSPQGGGLQLQGARGDDLVVEAPGSGTSGNNPHAAIALQTTDMGPSVLADSVAHALGAGVDAVMAAGGAGNGQAMLANVTAVAEGSGSVAVASAMTKGALSLTDVIARGAAGDIMAAPQEENAVAAQVAYSNFRPSASSGYLDGGHNQQLEPLFANAAAGDFHELAGSATIDAGTLSPASGMTDPDGNPRTLGLAPDIGAYEFNPAAGGPGAGAPAPPTSPTPAPGQPGGGAGPAPGGPASNTGVLGGAMFATGSQRLPRPQAGKTFIVRRLRGIVVVQIAHLRGYVPLPERALLPMGSQVDTRHGAVQLVAAKDLAGDLEHANFHAGVFRTDQRRPTRRSSRPTVLTTLTGNELAGCPRLPNGRRAPTLRQAAQATAVASAARRRRHRHRSLWSAETGGSFSTHGDNSVAAVRGTMWGTTDYCYGTLTQVVRGVVVVHDLGTGRRVRLTAGQHYFADLRRAPPLRRPRRR